MARSCYMVALKENLQVKAMDDALRRKATSTNVQATKSTEQGILEDPRVADTNQRVETTVETILAPIQDGDDPEMVRIGAEMGKPSKISYENFLRNMPKCSHGPMMTCQELTQK